VDGRRWTEDGPIRNQEPENGPAASADPTTERAENREPPWGVAWLFPAKCLLPSESVLPMQQKGFAFRFADHGVFRFVCGTVHSSETPHSIQVNAWRKLGAEGRTQLGIALRRDARRWKLAALRSRHPDWPEARLREELKQVYLRGIS